MSRRLAYLSNGAVLLCALVLTSCSRETNRNTPSVRPPVPVVVGKVGTMDLPVRIQSVGTVQPYSTVAVRSQITGPILEVHFQEGQEVREGDLLFTIDPRPWQAALNQARANLQRNEAQLINARLQFLRTSNLFAIQIASQADYEAAEAAYLALQSAVLADTAALSNAQVNLEYTLIRAPITGRTGDLAAKSGNVVKATDNVLVTITRTKPVYVAFAVPEQHLPDIRRRAAEAALPVTAAPPGSTEPPAVGELTFLDNMVDTNTGTILLKATFPNTDERLWPGQFVQAVLTLSNITDAVVVPEHAVQTGQDGEFVFVVKPDDSTVEVRPVRAGVTYEGWRAVSGNIRPGEIVVTDGQLRLTPGARVEMKGDPQPAKGSNSAPGST
ncbi:MAG TPA: efflux RND transporter periplasmic adaptor subunit [Verrucomicrobiota bacterium]|nr:efflux RND transporter periplasmic adaptor subunit [Verrucomicrobiota bacterium]